MTPFHIALKPKKATPLLTASIIALAIAACSTSEAPEDKTATIGRDASSSELVKLRAARQTAMGNAYSLSAGIAAPAMSVPAYTAPAQVERETYEEVDQNPVKLVSEEPVSTFSADVDTASYSVMRRYISKQNQLPPSNAVRTEELVNYFDYDYATPKSADEPFSPTLWLTPSPWADERHLMHIGVKGFDAEPEKLPAANIVLLLDVSGSMNNQDKLPLVKQSVKLLLKQMDKNDTVSIVVYAGAAGVVLEPTPANKRRKIEAALDNLSAGGSTAGGAGLALAYDLAAENFDKDKINRIILATDGDFNVGRVDADSLEDFVARKRDEGVFLSVLGFGRGNYNDHIAQKLAQSGNGVAAYIDTLDEARKVLVREFRSSIFPIAKDLKFQVEFNPAQVAEYRLIGYETRALNREDFNDDSVDAGDIGSGHTVSALYELTLTGAAKRQIDPLRYQAEAAPTDVSGELAFLRLRYKLPDSDTSKLIERPVTRDDMFASLSAAPDDARFAAAVAAFGQKLNRTKQIGDFSFDEIIALADPARGRDPYGERAGFVSLVRAAKTADE